MLNIKMSFNIIINQIERNCLFFFYLCLLLDRMGLPSREDQFGISYTANNNKE